MYQPVMATTVVYMQKLLGRKAVGQGEKVSTASPRFTQHLQQVFYRNLTVAGKTGTTSHRGQDTKAKGIAKISASFLRTQDAQGRQAKSLFERHSNRKKQEAATETGLEIVTQRTKFESTLILS